MKAAPLYGTLPAPLPSRWYEIRAERRERLGFRALSTRDIERGVMYRWLRLHYRRNHFRDIPDDWLTPKQWRVLSAFWFSGKTQRIIGAENDVSGPRAHQIVTHAEVTLWRLRVRQRIRERSRVPPMVDWPVVGRDFKQAVPLRCLPTCRSITSPLPVGCTCGNWGKTA